ncbi:hypothetical protein DERP_000408, partial [Dermatophagoides pteronyssinus]
MNIVDFIDIAVNAVVVVSISDDIEYGSIIMTCLSLKFALPLQSILLIVMIVDVSLLDAIIIIFEVFVEFLIELPFATLVLISILQHNCTAPDTLNNDDKVIARNGVVVESITYNGKNANQTTQVV